MSNTTSFWNLPKHSKLDVLQDGDFNHADVIIKILADTDTHVEFVSKNTYSVYSDEEALLIQPRAPVFRIGMFLYCSVLSFLCRAKI